MTGYGGAPAPWPSPAYLQDDKAAASSVLLRSLSAVIALLLVASVIAGVAIGRSGASKPSAAALVKAAPQTTVHARTARFTATVSISGPVNLTQKLTGASDFATNTTEINLAAAGVTETIRLVGGAEYFDSPLLTLPAGAHWVKIVPQDLGLSSVPASDSHGDASQGLTVLAATVGPPTVLGRQSVDGVTATHYGVVLNLQGVFDRVGKAQSSLSPGLANGFQSLAGQVDLTRVPGDVWLDSAGRVRRFSYHLSFTAAGRPLTELETIDYSHFGEPVHVAVPPAAETVPFSSVKDQLSLVPSGQVH